MSKSKKKHEIFWTPIALESYESIALQLIERWNIGVAKSFDSEVQNAIEILKSNPKLGKLSKTPNLRKYLIHENTSLIYRIKGDTLELILFVDNRSEHGF